MIQQLPVTLSELSGMGIVPSQKPCPARPENNPPPTNALQNVSAVVFLLFLVVALHHSEIIVSHRKIIYFIINFNLIAFNVFSKFYLLKLNLNLIFKFNRDFFILVICFSIFDKTFLFSFKTLTLQIFNTLYLILKFMLVYFSYLTQCLFN